MRQRLIRWWGEQDWHAMRPQWRWLVGPGLILVAVIGVATGLLVDRKTNPSRTSSEAGAGPSTTQPRVLGAYPEACERSGYGRKAFGSEPSAATRSALIYLSANVDGTHTDPYTGQPLELDGADADHLVPLAYAWDHGACRWPVELRVRFAADLGNLRLTSAGLNRSKGDSGPDEWLPPVAPCIYLADFVRITYEYRLELDPALDAARAEACGR
jgi:hypothetical protein